MEVSSSTLFLVVSGLVLFGFVLGLLILFLRFVFRINDIVAEQRRTNALLESLINQPNPPSSDRAPE